MTDKVEYGVVVQEDELADERVEGRTYDRAEAVETARRMPFTRCYAVEHTGNGWAEVSPLSRA